MEKEQIARNHGNFQQQNSKEVAFRGTSDSKGRERAHRGKLKNLEKSHVEWYRCHMYGHCKSKYRTNLNKICGAQSNHVEVEDEEISLLMVYHEGDKVQPNRWYLDMGCNNHMRGGKTKFSRLVNHFTTL